MTQRLFTARADGFSNGEFASNNLALHVGDDPLAVQANRALLARSIGIDEVNVHYMNQVHGRAVAIVGDNLPVETPTADSLFTSTRGHALVTLIADCVPVLLAAPEAIAAVHVGRQGLMVGVIEATLDTFKAHGIDAAKIFASIGPSICGTCYEVDLDMYREVTAQHPATRTSETLRCLDIAGGVMAVLRERGIRFEASGECTICTPGYFSYRRDGRTGRQAGVIWF